jgi:hypothetical protein
MARVTHVYQVQVPQRHHDGRRAKPHHVVHGDAPTRHRTTTALPPSAFSHLPGQAAALQRATLADLQQLHGNGHVQRLIDHSRPRQTATAALQRQPNSTPTLGPGARGPAVMTLQQQLNGAGASIEADGDFGTRTRAAVVAFQQGAGLTADGIVGPQTWQRLQSGARVPAAPAAGQAADPQQAILLAKLGQVRVALKGLQVQGSGSPSAAAPSSEQKPVKPIQGKPVPTCGLPVPTGDAAPKEQDHSGHGLLQRSFLDDAASWVEEKAESAGEWVGEKAEAASSAVGDAAGWVGDQVGAAGEWAEEQVSAAATAAEDAVSGASSFLADEAKQVVEDVKEIAGEAKEAVAGGIEVVVQTASELAKDVGEFGDDLKKRFANEIAIVQQVIQDLGKGIPDVGGLIKQLDDLLKGLTGGGATNWFGWFGKEDPDPVSSKVYAIFDVASSVTRGGVKVPGGTGYSEPTFSFKPVSWFRATDDAIMVQSTLNIDCHWEIASEGRGTSITSANDPAVTEISYLTIINDLESMKGGGGAVTTYWSEPLIERHELFHCRDYIGEATSYLPTAQGWFESQQVNHPPGNDAGVDAQVQKLVADTRQKVEDDGRAYFDKDKAGEARAYGDGKASYDALIAAIKARAKASKWKGSSDL